MNASSPLVVGFLAGAAFVAGFVDSIAGGGGLVTLPALMALGVAPPLALATNKGQAVFGAVASARSFWRRGLVDKERAPWAFAAGALGSVLGAWVLLHVRPEPLRPIVLGLLVFVAALLAFKGNPEPRVRELRSPKRILVVLALALGFYDGFFGPGVGSLLIAMFAYVFGDSLLRASANAKVINLASNLAAVIVFAVRGTIVWSWALPMAVANALGATVGSHMAVRGGDRFVRYVVLVVVSLVVVKVALDARS